MKYIPGFKFTITSNTGSNRPTIFNNRSKSFVKSPIPELELNIPYEISLIKPIKEDDIITSVKYTFSQTIKGRGKKLINVSFASIKDAEDILDTITQTSENVSEVQPNSNLQQRLRERSPLAANQVRSHRIR